MTSGALPDLDDAREDARRVLAEAYAHDLFGQEELDRRLELLERTRDLADLSVLTADVEVLRQRVPISAPSAVMLPTSGPVRAVFSSIARKGPWRPATVTRVRVVFGEATLDLRQAQLGPDVTRLELDVLCGSVEILVLPGVHVDVDCTAFLAEVEQEEAAVARVSGPRVLVTGRAVLAAVTVRERLPGEGKLAAFRRRRKALAEARQRALPPGDHDP